MAVLTYQLAYLGWTKLEQDEARVERQGMYPPYSVPWLPKLRVVRDLAADLAAAEITSLEDKVKRLQSEQASRRPGPSGTDPVSEVGSPRRWWLF